MKEKLRNLLVRKLESYGYKIPVKAKTDGIMLDTHVKVMLLQLLEDQDPAYSELNDIYKLWK